MKNILLVLEALGMGNGEWRVASGEKEESDIEYNIYGPVKDKNYWENVKLDKKTAGKYPGQLSRGYFTG
jgi:spore coat protein U-like protein